MFRWHKDYPKTFNQWKIHRKSHVESNKWKFTEDPFKVDCACDEQVGRFRKKDAWDCGNTKCKICHSDKFPKRELTRQEEKSNLSFKEQTSE